MSQLDLDIDEARKLAAQYAAEDLAKLEAVVAELRELGQMSMEGLSPADLVAIQRAAQQTANAAAGVTLVAKCNLGHALKELGVKPKRRRRP